MHRHTGTPIAEQRWTSPDLTCSLICFRGDCLFLFLICCMYVLTAMCEVVIKLEYFTASVIGHQWGDMEFTKLNKGNHPIYFPSLSYSCGDM